MTTQAAPTPLMTLRKTPALRSTAPLSDLRVGVYEHKRRPVGFAHLSDTQRLAKAGRFNGINRFRDRRCKVDWPVGTHENVVLKPDANPPVLFRNV